MEYWIKRAVNLFARFITFGKYVYRYSPYFCIECMKLVSREHNHIDSIRSFGWKGPNKKEDEWWNSLPEYTPCSGVGALPEEAEVKGDGPIRAQGNEGSCVGQAGVACQDSILARQNRLPKGGLSSRCAYNGARKIGGRLTNYQQGAYIKDLCTFLQQWGNVKETEWPYVAKQDMDVDPTVKFHHEMGARYRVVQYFKITSVDNLKAAIADGHNVCIGTPWFGNWTRITVVNPYLPPASGSIIGYHAIRFKAYKKHDDKTFFKFQNSWGSLYGVSGYAYMQQPDVKRFWDVIRPFAVVEMVNAPPIPPDPDPEPDPEPIPDIMEKIKEAINNIVKWLKEIERRRVS